MVKAAAVLFASALAVGAAARAGDGPAAGSARLPEAPESLRLLVKLLQPLADATSVDPAEIARRATETAGQPATCATAGSDRVILQLACAPADCEAAVQRLRDAKGLFASVERDERRRHHRP